MKSMLECLQDRKLKLFGYVERVEESIWSSKRRSLKVSDGFSR